MLVKDNVPERVFCACGPMFACSEKGMVIKMNIIRYIILGFIGITSGAMVAAGLFAFITLVGVVERMAARSKTNKYIRLYEDMVLFGAMFGNIISIFKINVPMGNTMLIIFGIFSGVFVGCLSVALAEILNVIPVFTKRIKLKYGMPILVICFAVAKGLGALYQFMV